MLGGGGPAWTYLVEDIEIVGQGVAPSRDGAIISLQNGVVEVAEVWCSGIDAVGHVDDEDKEISRWRDSTGLWWLKLGARHKREN